MGNTISSSDENKSKLTNKIDDIASKYILSQSFDDMNKMSEKGYCDKMVILTAKIINNNLTPLEQKEVVQRMYPTKNNENEKEEKEEELKDKDDNNNRIEMQRPVSEPVSKMKEQLGGDESDNTQPDCVKIAKFYVKIAHLFAAIMKTVNPVIISVNKEGKKQKYDLMSKQNMPTDEEILTIEHNNFCTKRINNLLQESDYDKSNLNNISVSLKPRFCNINYDKNSKTTRKFYTPTNNNININNNNDNNNNNNRIGINDSYKGGEYDDIRNRNIESRNIEKYRGRDEDKDKRDGDGDRGRGRDEDKRDGDGDKDKKNGDGDEDINKLSSKMRNSDNNMESKNQDKPQLNKYKESEKDEIPLVDNGSELGIPELLKLYYDEYDEERGDYTTMSAEMTAAYANDLEIFYKTFTGKNIALDDDGNKTITKFEQIPLMDFHNNEKCKGDGLLTEKYDGTFKDKLFREYALHVKEMTNHMNTNQDKLLQVLDKLFTFKKPKPTPTPTPTPNENKDNEAIGKEGNESDKMNEQENKLKQIMDTRNKNGLQGLNEIENPPPQAEAQAQVGGIKEVDDVTLKINPELDDGLLKSLINSTRQLIVEMYITCESDFLKGITLFEGIVAAQLANTTTSKIRLLNDLTVGYLHNH